MGHESASPSRRTVLKATGAAGAAGLAGIAGCIGDPSGTEDSLGNYPPEGDSVTYGFCGPLSGALDFEGAEQERGFELAIEHLNNGGGAVEYWDQLSGEGVLDYEVEGVGEDSGMEADSARSAVEGMIEGDNIQFWTGGMMSPVTIEGEAVSRENNVPFIGGNSTSASISGENCSRYYFHPGFHAETIALGASELLPDLFEGSKLFHIYLDYSYGQSNRDAQDRYLTGDDGPWEKAGEYGQDDSEPDHSTAVSELEDSDADILHLASYGGFAADTLSVMEENDILGDYEVYIPHISNMTIDPLGGLVDRVYGFEPWNPNLAEEDDAAAAFVEAYEDEHDETPSQSAWTTYDSVMHYSAAVEDNGSFHPAEVVRTLEEFSWDQGYGQTLSYRECDHTAERPMYLVQGSDEGYRTDVLEATEPIINGCDEFPSSECNMDDQEYGDE